MELATRHGRGPVSGNEIGQSQDLSPKYVHEILTLLIRTGLVRSIRGCAGGYVLTRHPSKITILEIVQAVEGPIALVHCVLNPKRCQRVAKCPARRLWRELGNVMSGFLRSVSLADLTQKRSPLFSH